MISSAFFEKREELSILLTANEPANLELGLESTVEELSLYNTEVDINQPGEKLARLFEKSPLLPGVILTEHQDYYGMISRHRFFEYLSRPFGREVFIKRPIKSLYQFVQSDILLIPSDTLIVYAARRSLQRSPEMLYEPIVVKKNETYWVLDLHELLVAQSKIHEIATKVIRQQTQNQLIQTEKLASLGQLVSGIAHELRNPISCISGNMDFLSNYFQDLLELVAAYEREFRDFQSTQIPEVKEQIEWEFLQEDLPEILESMTVSSKRLKDLVNSLHHFSHMDGSQQQESDIHECLESVLLILKNPLKKYRINIVKEYEDLPLISCYSGQLSQVFINIISNAIDALQEKTYLPKFTPTLQIYTHLYFSEIDRKQWIMVKIIDNGMGMSSQVKERMFEMFFTTKSAGKGTGLGLAITHQIITEKHQGQIKVNSTEGEGTEFIILLPIISKLDADEQK